MIRSIIIDDEPHCIDRLQSLLKNYCAEIVRNEGCCLTIPDGLKAIERMNPDLVFLDVQFQDGTGFDLLKQITPIDFEIIFTTAFDKYAIEAFRFSAMDYLLKPVEKDNLMQAIHRVNHKLSKDMTAKKLEVLLDNLNGQSKKISVPTLSGLTFIPVRDIIHCWAQVNYTQIFLKGGQKILVSKTLKEFEFLLRDYQFFRIHQSHLINLQDVKKYQKGKGGSVIMSDNTEIEVSTRKKEEFLRRLASI